MVTKAMETFILPKHKMIDVVIITAGQEYYFQAMHEENRETLFALLDLNDEEPIAILYPNEDVLYIIYGK